MGQRSQIYVRVTKAIDKYNESYETVLVARYFAWNFGERMVSRARYIVEWLKEHLEYDGKHLERTGKNLAHLDGSKLRRLVKVIETNFDAKDVAETSDIVEEYRVWGGYNEPNAPDFTTGFISYVFTEHDNNDGKLFIDVLTSGEIKYAFTDGDANTDNIIDGNAYMKWNGYGDFRNKLPTEYFTAEDIKTCDENISAIEKTATLMTKEELEEFIHHDYEIRPYTAEEQEDAQKKPFAS